MFCVLSPVQLPNNSGAVPPKKISIEFVLFFFQFQEKFAIWPRVQMVNDNFQHDLRSINRVEKRNF